VFLVLLVVFPLPVSFFDPSSINGEKRCRPTMSNAQPAYAATAPNAHANSQTNRARLLSARKVGIDESFLDVIMLAVNLSLPDHWAPKNAFRSSFGETPTFQIMHRRHVVFLQSQTQRQLDPPTSSLYSATTRFVSDKGSRQLHPMLNIVPP